MSVTLYILGNIRYEFYLVFLEPSWVTFIISGIDGRVVSAWTISMASMIQTCHVAPWPAMSLSDTYVWTTRVARYNISIPNFSRTP